MRGGAATLPSRAQLSPTTKTIVAGFPIRMSALLGVADTPIRLTRAESALAGATPDEATFAEAAKQGIEGVEPRADIHADGEYRVALLGTLVERALAASARRVAR